MLQKPQSIIIHKSRLLTISGDCSETKLTTTSCVSILADCLEASSYQSIIFHQLIPDVTQEGIFRRTGSLSRQQELRQLLLTGSNLGLSEGRFSVHDCASVLKGFLAELPQPLLMDQYYQTYCTLAG